MVRIRHTLQWRHNEHDSVSNHQPYDCLLNRLFRRRSKKTSNLRVTGLCVGNSPGPVNSPHKGPVTRKMFPFDDVIMNMSWLYIMIHICGSGAKYSYKVIPYKLMNMTQYTVLFIVYSLMLASIRDDKSAQRATHNPKFVKMGLFRHPRWWYLR